MATKMDFMLRKSETISSREGFGKETEKGVSKYDLENWSIFSLEN